MQEEIERQYAAYVESLARAEAAAYYAGHNEGYTDHYQRAG